MSQPTDQELDLSVAGMLRIGLSISAVVVLGGGAMLLRHPLVATPNYFHFHAGDPALRSVTGILQGAIDLAPRSVIQLGLLLLIATPVARVVFCIVGFARQRSLLYVAVSTMVLAVLIYSFIEGGR